MKTLKRISLILISLVFLSILLLWLFDLQTGPENPLLLFFIIIIFVGIVSVVISVISAKSFIDTGNWAILWLGVGALVFGLGGGLATGLYGFNLIEINANVTIHNVLSLAASFIFLISAILLSTEAGNVRKYSSRIIILIQIYFTSLASVVMVLYLILGDILPQFFIPGIGGTTVRQVVLILTVVFFLSAGLIYLRVHYQSNFNALYWASASMVLLSIGFIALMLQREVGSPINWLGRFSNSLAGIYLLFFITSIFIESRKQKISSTEIFDLYFREKIANYKMVFENINECILIIDNKENILGFNDAFLSFYKFRDRSKCPKTIKELSSYIETFNTNGEKISYEEYSIKKALKGKSSYRIERIFKRKDTGQRWYGAYSCSPLLDESNNIIGAVQIAADITLHKEAEKEKLKSFENKILEMERKKIARELHDTVSQNLFSSSLFSDTILKAWERDPKKTLKYIEKVRDLNAAALTDVQILLLDLIPEKIYQEDMVVLIERLLNSVKNDSRIKTEFKVEGDHEIDPETKQELYRIVQESLNNIVKHSEATLIKVHLRIYPDELKMTIADNGKGFDINGEIATRRFGLQIMKERAKKIEAKLDIESSVGSGTIISLSKIKF